MHTNREYKLAIGVLTVILIITLLCFGLYMDNAPACYFAKGVKAVEVADFSTGEFVFSKELTARDYLACALIGEDL